MKDGILEIGDALYDTSRWHGIERKTVVSLTPKRAKLSDDSYCDKIVHFDNKGKAQAKKVADYGYWDLETPEWITRYARQNLVQLSRRYLSALSSADFGNFSNEQLVTFNQLVFTMLPPIK